MIAKPYKRIYRPEFIPAGNILFEDNYGYLLDNSFLDQRERESMLFSARLIIADFEKLFEYIQPLDVHKDVYSHRIYELFFRACTEIEANCKSILQANGYAVSPDRMTMNDYCKLEQATKLSGYTINYQKWFPVAEVHPFSPWLVGGSLPWYQAYNHVKHNRFTHFNEATMGNLLDAICALVCLLHVQLGKHVDTLFESNIYSMSVESEEVSAGAFCIVPPTFIDDEKYQFEWNTLKNDPCPFNLFPFL